MNVHENARLTPLGRERLIGMIAGGMSFSRFGAVCGCSAKTAAKGWRRYEQEGREGLQDRGSRPCSLRKPTPDGVADRITALRRQRRHPAPGALARQAATGCTRRGP
ncbi:leucine zipper domain-containing protein [Frigidibacter sp. SD6-1]|uniref:leucine zipper domain-containing protein n=1 Tax=Frigidibacter sp. SD6-1 TaxID=3032581 RepID=UPI0032E92C18